MSIHIQVELPPKTALKSKADYPKVAEYRGFTFEEWQELAMRTIARIAVLQEAIAADGRPIEAVAELYPEVHALSRKLTSCMALALTNGAASLLYANGGSHSAQPDCRSSRKRT